MNISDLPEESDTSDEDYTPEGKPEEVPSEEDSNGETEEPLSESEEVEGPRRKRSKKAKKPRRKLKVNKTDPKAEEIAKPTPVASDEKKKTEDDIWADFMKDTGFQSKTARSETVANNKTKTNGNASSQASKVDNKSAVGKVKVTQVFEFAGEEVRVEKEVRADSAEARLLNKSTGSSQPEPDRPTRGRGGLSGIGSVLNQLGKKPKISTLEKSKLDWDRFKKEENIEEELQTHNKGKDGYLERQDFLERADLRRFEIEKEIRAVERSKRLNNS